MERIIIMVLAVVNMLLAMRLIRLTMLLNTYEAIMEEISKRFNKMSRYINEGSDK